MKKLQYLVGVSVSFMMLGCMGSKPSVSMEKAHKVTLENGKQYLVPVGAVYTKAPVTAQALQFYTVMGVSNCKYGDITWEAPGIANKINKIMRSGTKQEGIEMYVKAAKNKEIGCASPLK